MEREREREMKSRLKEWCLEEAREKEGGPERKIREKGLRERSERKTRKKDQEKDHQHLETGKLKSADKKMYTLLIAAAILGLTSAQWTPPKYCGKNSCPRFQVDNEVSPLVKRRYDATKWVTTNKTGMAMIYDFATPWMFWKLFRYIDGHNTDEKKINMTAPVLVKVTPGSPHNFEMSFYLDIEDPPQPKDDSVYLTNLPQNFDVYVREYGGISTELATKLKYKDLKGKLDAQSLKYNTTYYFTASYNSPWEIFKMHNEIWIPKN